MKGFLIGAGKSGTAIYNATLYRDDIDIIGIGGGSGESTKLLANNMGVPIFEQKDWSNIFDVVDVVFIASPHYFHFNQVISALEHKCHVLVEKPATINREDLSKILKATTNSNYQIYCGFVQRCHDDMTRCRNYLSQRSEDILGATITQYLKRGIDYYSSWKGNVDISGGGVLINQAIHAIDLVLYLMDATPHTVSCITSRSRGISVEDYIQGSILSNRGPIGISALTRSAVEEVQVIRIFLPECTVLVVGTETPRWSMVYNNIEREIKSLSIDATPFGIGHKLWVEDAINSIRMSCPSIYQCDIKSVAITHNCIFGLYESSKLKGVEQSI